MPAHLSQLFATWSFAERPCADAWPGLRDGGSGLDAVEAVCRGVEDDPGVDSVGFGGLPDRAGAVTLDGCVMLDPRRCGSVCAVERHPNPVSLARLVMERTPHVMLAGPGADRFADEQGLAEAAAMCSDEARAKWLSWKDGPHEIDQSRDSGYVPEQPVDSGAGGILYPGETGHDTVGVLALAGDGTLAGACSTSGTPYKTPGRVGDAPIIGHGLYVDPAGGAATATGTGELVMGLCSSFHVVEQMRAGTSPRDAVLTALDRIAEAFELRPVHQVAIIALTPGGERFAGALRPGFKSVVSDDDGTRVEDPDAVLLE
ncbi:MAG: isoaspartyl peptidase/L-asparaginase [Planctomycetota bacterium]|jgi:isoaspartyl peptidase/L-asparaginase-like protein (Ntn-hydrolase superfamily)